MESPAPVASMPHGTFVAQWWTQLVFAAGGLIGLVLVVVASLLLNLPEQTVPVLFWGAVVVSVVIWFWLLVAGVPSRVEFRPDGELVLRCLLRTAAISSTAPITVIGWDLFGWRLIVRGPTPYVLLGSFERADELDRLLRRRATQWPPAASELSRPTRGPNLE